MPKNWRKETRTAPKWAWNVIDETLSMDSVSSAFDKKLRDEIGLAYAAMETVKPRRPAQENDDEKTPNTR